MRYKRRQKLILIQYDTKLKAKAVVVSLDVEKAFNRVEWLYLLVYVAKYIWEITNKWISLLYDSPRACVLTNGWKSPAFLIGHGTRQGCPIPPLLFVHTIECLGEVTRCDPSVTGINVGPHKHKMSLYVDDGLLFLSNPKVYY